MDNGAPYSTRPNAVRETLGRWILTDGMPLVYDTARSHDAFIVDAVTGDEYLDMFSFFASMPLGHNHPGLSDPAYLERLAGASVAKVSNSDIYTPAMADFVAAIGRTMPEGFSHLFFIEGGALAVENALKVAFDWKVRKNVAKGLVDGDTDAQKGTKILHFERAFHGRSGYTLSLTNGFAPNKTKYFPKFDWPRVPTPAQVFPATGDNLATTQRAEAASLAKIREAVAADPDGIAAIIVETIQGEGGDNHFRDEFLRALKDVCLEHEMLLIFDEIQCGFGMTGRWWAFEHQGVTPDIFSFGKKTQVCGIAAGPRVDEVDSCFKVSSRINSTWGGNLVDMVRCTRYVEIIEQDGLIQNAATVGEYLLGKLRDLSAASDAVSNARGRGLMCAFDLPDAATRDRLLELCYEDKLLMLPCGPASLRVRPSLDFTTELVDSAMERLQRALGRL
ncbi:MAG: L-lysine 6-transaminase [Myxococcota bacterium]